MHRFLFLAACGILLATTFSAQAADVPTVAIIVSDDHYKADTTLPEYAKWLEANYALTTVIIHGHGTSNFPDMAKLRDADCAIFYVRRLTPPVEQMAIFKKYIKDGGALVALRTASHGFALRGSAKPPEGCATWNEFDPEILGGSYNGHGSNSAGSDIRHIAGKADHPILAGVTPTTWHSTGSLYRTKPLADDCTLLQEGTSEGNAEPVTWTRELKTGGRMAYSALGHPDDFELPQFKKLLAQMIFWSMDKPVK